MSQDLRLPRHARVQRRPVDHVRNCEPYAHRSVVYNSTAMSLIVEIESQTSRFGVFAAVDSETITAKAGELFGLLGI